MDGDELRKQDTGSAVERDRSPHPKSLYLQSTDTCTASFFLSILCQNIADARGGISLSLVKSQVKKFLSAACPQGQCAEAPFCVAMTVAIEFHSRALIRAHVRLRRHFAKLPHQNSRALLGCCTRQLYASCFVVQLLGDLYKNPTYENQCGRRSLSNIVLYENVNEILFGVWIGPLLVASS